MTDNITVSRELLRQVLRGLRMCDQQNQVLDDTYTALRAALEQPAPVQDTTGYMNAGQVHEMQQWRAPYAYVYPKSEAGARIAIYTAPQPDRIAQLEAANTNLFEQGQKMHKRIQELESDCKIGAQEMVKAYEEIDNLKAQVSHQEPVAWCQLGLDGKSIAYFDDCAASPTGKHSESWFCNSNCTHCGTGAVDEPLYWHDTETDTPTAPPAQTPPRLTDEEVHQLWKSGAATRSGIRAAVRRQFLGDRDDTD